MNKQYRIVTILRGIVSSVVLDMTEDDSIKYQRHLIALKEEGYLEHFQCDEVFDVSEPIAVKLVIYKSNVHTE